MKRTTLLNQLKQAKEAVLQEILREAEIKINAQLQASLAADQRAFT